MNIQTINDYYENGIIDEENRRNMIHLLNKMMGKVIRDDLPEKMYIV